MCVRMYALSLAFLGTSVLDGNYSLIERARILLTENETGGGRVTCEGYTHARAGKHILGGRADGCARKWTRRETTAADGDA